jgi:hypothetical protein
MKFKMITLYISLFWFAMFVGGLWALKVLIQAAPDPYFASGLLGGAIWCLVMRAIWDVLAASLRDFLDEWRNGLSRGELKAIKAGLSEVNYGLTVPLEEVRQRLRDETLERERKRIQKQEVCSDKSHWRSE